jgi:hypothetical protein
MAPPRILNQTISTEDTFLGPGLSQGHNPQFTKPSTTPEENPDIAWLDAKRDFEHCANSQDNLGDGFYRSIAFWGEVYDRFNFLKPTLEGWETNVHQAVARRASSSLRDRNDIAVVRLDDLSELISKTALLSSPPAERIRNSAELNLLKANQLFFLLRLTGFRVITDEEFEKSNSPPVPFTKKEDIEAWESGIQEAKKNYKSLGVSIVSLSKIEKVLTDPSSPNPLEGKENLRKFLSQIGIDLTKIIDSSSPVIFTKEENGKLLSSVVGPWIDLYIRASSLERAINESNSLQERVLLSRLRSDAMVAGMIGTFQQVMFVTPLIAGLRGMGVPMKHSNHSNSIVIKEVRDSFGGVERMTTAPVDKIFAYKQGPNPKVARLDLIQSRTPGNFYDVYGHSTLGRGIWNPHAQVRVGSGNVSPPPRTVETPLGKVALPNGSMVMGQGGSGNTGVGGPSGASGGLGVSNSGSGGPTLVLAPTQRQPTVVNRTSGAPQVAVEVSVVTEVTTQTGTNFSLGTRQVNSSPPSGQPPSRIPDPLQAPSAFHNNMVEPNPKDEVRVFPTTRNQTSMNDPVEDKNRRGDPPIPKERRQYLNPEDVTKPLEPLTDEEMKKLREIYKKYPNLKEAFYHKLKKAFDQTHWSLKEQYFLDGKAEPLFPADEYLPMKKSDWSLEQEYQLLTLLAEKAGGNVDSAYRNLQTAIHGMEETGWSLEQKSQLLTLLAEKAGVHVGSAYSTLPTAINGIRNTGWSLEQKSQLLTLLAKKAEGDVGSAYSTLPSAILEMRNTGWSSEQQYQLLTLLAEKAGGDVGLAYRDLEVAIHGMEKTGWSYEQKSQLLTLLAEKAGGDVDLAYAALSTLFAERTGGYVDSIYMERLTVISNVNKTGWSKEQKYQFVIELVNKSGKEFFLAAGFTTFALSHTPRSQVDQTKDFIFRFLDQLSDYNRRRVLGLFGDNKSLFNLFGEKYFPSHFELYVTLFERWPRLGFNLLEGILEGTKKGIVPRDLSGTHEKIFHFIEQTHGFIPTLYQAYLKEGEALFPKLRTYVNAILRDELSLEDAQRIIVEHGEEFLLGIIQMTSPTSGASFVKKEEQLGLLKKMMEAGDLRGHIPEKWKNKIETFLLTQGAWSLKEEKVADPEGKIKALLNEFRVPEKTPKVEEKQLVEALQVYLQSGRTPEAREKVKKILYQYAGQNDALREKIDRIQDAGYTTLILLEQLFGDKDNLQKMIAEALAKVPEELLAVQGTKRKIEGDGKRLVKSLKKVWEDPIGGKNLSEEKRIEILASILKAYEIEDIETKILARNDLSNSFKEAIRQVMHEAPTLGKKQIISDILSEPMELIKTEKGKYNYQDAGTITVGLRAVKGPTYGCWTLSAGVCTVDEQLWKDPNFKLLAISVSDPQLSPGEMKRVVGYIHVYETIIDGKKYITLPGINPSAEFMGTVDPKKLYEGIMEKVINFAKAGGYHGVYIPTDPNIHSNRSDFQKAIQKAGYPIKQIPTVNWNTKPSPYPFSRVYGVWERD